MAFETVCFLKTKGVFHLHQDNYTDSTSKKDYEAVKAGRTLAWSQSPVEGHVHRLKLIKRYASECYGAARKTTQGKRNPELSTVRKSQ